MASLIVPLVAFMTSKALRPERLEVAPDGRHRRLADADRADRR